MTLHTTKALRHLLLGTDGNGQPCPSGVHATQWCAVPDVTVWDYASQFDELWTMAKPRRGHAIVVWADTPIDPSVRPVNTEPHVTPFDWAIAARSHHPDLRVTVLDLRADRSVKTYPALTWLETQRPESVPWLRRIDIASLLDAEQAGRKGLRDFLVGWPNEETDRTRARAALEQAERTLSDLKKALARTAELDSAVAGSLAGVDATVGLAASVRAELEGSPTAPLQAGPDDALEMLWGRIRTGESGHHAVANLIGPLLLLQQPPRVGHREALRQLLVAAGRAPAKVTAGGADPSLLEALHAVAPVRVILVDDQWHHGWARWVSEFLGLNWEEAGAQHMPAAAATGTGELPGSPQRVASSPDERITLWVSGIVWAETITAKGPDRSWLLRRMADGTDSRFRLRLTDGDDNAAEILLLDMRLFLRKNDARGDEVVTKAEQHFADALVTIARALDTSRSPWPYLEDRELEKIEAWLRGGDHRANQELDPSILTLLPRVLAQIDLSLPIVLFSSTGRRDIVEELRGYGSILTNFAKPRLLDDAGGGVLEESRDSLIAALESAARLAAARRFCSRIVTAESNSAILVGQPITATVTTTPPRRVEIYLEESGGGQWMQVGGILAQYTDERAAASFSECLRTAGWVWGHDCDTPNAPTPRSRRKKASDMGSVRTIAAGLAEIDKLATDAGVTLSAFVIRATREIESQDLLPPGSPDHVYRSLTRAALECALFSWPGSQVAGAEVALYIATRLRYCRDKAAYQELQDRWGVDYRPYGAYVFSFDDAYPIVTDILGARPAHAAQPNVVVAKGVGLRYYPQPSNIEAPKLPRQIHYVTDWVASSPASVPSSWWVHGFRDIADQSCEAMLDAARLADWGRNVHSLTSWRAAERGIGSLCLPMSAGRWVRQRVAADAGLLVGNEIVEIGDALARQSVGTLPAEVIVKGILQEHSRVDVEREVRSVLGEDGRTVVSMKVVQNRYPRDPRRPEVSVFVRFAEHDQARAAILLADGREVLGRAISLAFAK